MIKCHSYNISKSEYSFKNAIEPLVSELSSESIINWIDIESPDEKDYAALETRFGFHSLAVEDCKHFSLFPKMDEYDDYIFLVLHHIKADIQELIVNAGDDEKYLCIKDKYDNDFDKIGIQISEVDIFITKNSVITIHGENIKQFTHLSEKISRHPEHLKRGRDFILHQVIDLLIDNYLDVSHIWNEVIEILEEDVINKRVSNIIDKIIGLKRGLLLMRRTVSHEKDILAKLIRGTELRISRKTLIYLQDVHDHIMRLYDEIEINREMLSIIFDAYLSTVSNQMNKIMMKLTVIATVFMPLTFIAGVYGMNFRVFPEIEWHYGYLYVWIVFILVGLWSYKFLKNNSKLEKF